jgi:hypothetical protein
MKVNMVNDMCDRTIKMKINKDSILQNVNSNTNSIELTVKGLDTKSFNYKKQTHVNSEENNNIIKSDN